jgi:hypothetical protein
MHIRLVFVTSVAGTEIFHSWLPSKSRIKSYVGGFLLAVKCFKYFRKKMFNQPEREPQPTEFDGSPVSE